MKNGARGDFCGQIGYDGDVHEVAATGGHPRR